MYLNDNVRAKAHLERALIIKEKELGPNHEFILNMLTLHIVKPNGLKDFPGFKDEKLSGDLKHCRSSRLSIKYRVIYKENKKVKEVIVLSITPHKYDRV